MDKLHAKLLAHLSQKEFLEAVEMVKRDPVLLTMECDVFSELILFPLHRTLEYEAPYNIIVSFMDEWLQLEDFQTLSEMNLLHCACWWNAPLDVIHYLSSLFPDSLSMQTKRSGYIPLMYALQAKRDPDVIKCLSNSNVEYIGDFDVGDWVEEDWSHKNKVNKAIVDRYMVDESFIDSSRGMFRLEHKDPTLTCLVISDTLHSFLEMDPPDDFYGRNDEYEHLYESACNSIIHAISSHPHLTMIVFIIHCRLIDNRYVRQRDALIEVIRDKALITEIEVLTSDSDLRTVGHVLTNFPHVKSVKIASHGEALSDGYGMHDVSILLNKLPLLESVEFRNVHIYRGDARQFYLGIMKKNSMRRIVMYDTKIDHWLSSWFVRVTKDKPKLSHLKYMCLFDYCRPHSSHSACADWQEEIDLELADNILDNHTRGSILKFMNKIQSRGEINYSDHHFIDDMLDADVHDGKGEGDPLYPTDHLYSLIRAYPHFLNISTHIDNAYPFSNKRPKLI
jgi:hypothetical protein